MLNYFDSPKILAVATEYNFLTLELVNDIFGCKHKQVGFHRAPHQLKLDKITSCSNHVLYFVPWLGLISVGYASDVMYVNNGNLILVARIW